jgi:hypothetical protein
MFGESEWSGSMLSTVRRPVARRIFGSTLTCSFCGRSSQEVARLVAGARGYICDECVAKCVAILEEHEAADPGAPKH